MKEPEATDDCTTIDVADRVGILLWGFGFSVLFTIVDGPFHIGGRHSNNEIEIPEQYSNYVTWTIYVITAVLLFRVVIGILHNKQIGMKAKDEDRVR
ncbi:hypothetical protein VSU19_05990 [Verrucomicrobiales bacterium BCK34]|nr:hypothetical protein [Verrucomicrobiales bacterium BCK34]